MSTHPGDEIWLVTVSSPGTVTFSAVRETKKGANDFAKGYEGLAAEISVDKYERVKDD